MEPYSGLLATLLQFAQNGRKVAFTMMVFCFACIIVVKLKMLPDQINDFMSDKIGWVYLGFILAVAVLITEITWSLARFVRDNIATEQQKTKSNDNLNQAIMSLTKEEQSILWEFVRQNRRVLNIPGELHALDAVVRRGFVQCEGGTRLLGYPGDIRCIIENEIWDYLQEVKKSTCTS